MIAKFNITKKNKNLESIRNRTILIKSINNFVFMIPYQLEIKPKNKHIYLVVKDGELIVRANPFVTEKQIKKLIEQKSVWIKNHLQKSIKKPRLLSYGSSIYYLGKGYQLEIHCEGVKNLLLKNKKMKITGAKNNDEALVMLDLFYLEQSKVIVTNFLNKWSGIMQLSPRKVSYRKLKSRWGSCSYQNNLSFNTQLIQLPESIIEYVVVHELCHIVHKNHSHQFWQLVDHFLPSAPLLKKQLRHYEKQINFY